MFCFKCRIMSLETNSNVINFQHEPYTYIPIKRLWIYQDSSHHFRVSPAANRTPTPLFFTLVSFPSLSVLLVENSFLPSFACFSFFKFFAACHVFSYSFKTLFNYFFRILMANSFVHLNTFSSSSAKQNGTCNSQGAGYRTSAPQLLHEAFYLAIRQLSTRVTSALFAHHIWRALPISDIILYTGHVGY